MFFLNKYFHIKLRRRTPYEARHRLRVHRSKSQYAVLEFGDNSHPQKGIPPIVKRNNKLYTLCKEDAMDLAASL